MSFVAEFDALPTAALIQRARSASGADVQRLIAGGAATLSDFATLLSPAAGELLEPLCARSQALWWRASRFARLG